MNWQNFATFFKDRNSEITEAIFDFVEIESPSFDLEGSRKAVDFLVERTKALNCIEKIERISTAVGEHLIVRAFASTEKPILIVGHTDTVHPRGSKEKNPTRIEDGKLYGCGVFDMKANCILILEALRALEQIAGSNVPLPVTVFLSCDEEVGSVTGKAIVEQEALKSSFCLVCEPSANGKAKTGRKGTAGYKIQAHGIPAHAGLEPERGASAILELARQILQIQELNNKETGTTATVCQIKGGTASNVVPAEAECTVDVRFSTFLEAQRVDAIIKNLQPFDTRVKLNVTGGINRPPLERNDKVIALYEHAKKLAHEMGYELDETQVGGASDGNFVAALGLPVLDGLGIKGNGAHTFDEFICLDDISFRATLLSMLILQPFKL